MESPFVKCPHTCEYEPMGSQNQIMALLEGRHIIPNVVSSGGLEHVKEHILGGTYHPNCHQECPGSRYHQANTIEPLVTPHRRAFEGIVPQILTFFDDHTQLILRFFKNIAVDVPDEDIPGTATLAPWASIHPPSTRFAPGSVRPWHDAAPSLQLEKPYDIPYGLSLHFYFALENDSVAKNLDDALEMPNYGFIREETIPLGYVKGIKKIKRGNFYQKEIFRCNLEGAGLRGWIVSEWVSIYRHPFHTDSENIDNHPPPSNERSFSQSLCQA